MNNTEQITEVSKALTEFYMSFPYTRVNVQDDCLSYSVPFGYAEEIRKEADVLIGVLNLPLTAKTHSTHGVFTNVVMIIPNQNNNHENK